MNNPVIIIMVEAQYSWGWDCGTFDDDGNPKYFDDPILATNEMNRMIQYHASLPEGSYLALPEKWRIVEYIGD